MELFNLMAKLTLDADDFSRELDKAEKEIDSFEMPDDPKLGMDTSEFEENVGEAESLGEGFGSTMESIVSKIKTAITTAGIVGMIGGIVSKLKEAVDMTAETADSIDKGSKRLGISTTQYQKWDHALKQSGASISDLQKGLMNMQLAWKSSVPGTPFADAEDAVDKLADKTVGLSQDAYDALRELGLLDRLTAHEFDNAEQLMDAALMKLADYTKNGAHTTDERGILVRQLFGRGGDVLNAMLDEGYEGVKALMEEAEGLGLIMSEDEIANAVAYGDAVANLQAELQAIQQAFVADIIPVLSDAVTWLTDFLTKLNPRLQTSSIYSVIDAINEKTLAASTRVDAATVTAKALIEDPQSLGDYWSLDEQGRMTWDALASKALELFPQLSKYIDEDGKKIQGNTKDIENNIDAWARLEKQRLLSAAMAEKQEAVAKQLTEAYEKRAEAIEKEDEALGKKPAAYKAIDEFLASRRGEGYRYNMEARYGYTGTMTDEIYAHYGRQLNNWVKEGGGTGAQKQAIKEWEDLEDEAKALTEASDEMVEKAQKAQEGLADQQRYLGEAMGLTNSDILKATESVREFDKELRRLPTSVHMPVSFGGQTMYKKAIGDAYIPYDNFPALLHRGERVLTATEARNQGSDIDFADMENRIENAIRNGMSGVTVRSYLNGKEITAEVNRNNINDVKGRRFAT